jgi:prophage tail gpP-like protein
VFDAPAADEVSLEIDGKTFRFWTELTLSRRIDGFDSASFTAPFDPTDAATRETFRPFTYKPVVIRVGSRALFTGTMMAPMPEVTAEQKTVSVDCYSQGAVLGDTSMPGSAFPLEFSKLTLKQVAEKLCEPFGVAVEVDGEDGSPFDKVKLKASDKVGPFLADLAKQRGYILASSDTGGIVFRKSYSGFGVPVARLRDDAQPVLSVRPTFAPQKYFSAITCITKSKRGRKGSQYTEGNPFMSGVTRPGVIELDDTDPGDIQIATRAAIGRMYGNAAGYEVDIATWLREDGELYEPDDLVTLTAPGAMVYNESQLLIRTVEMRATAESKTATLGLMLPGAFSGEIPEDLPWLG